MNTHVRLQHGPTRNLPYGSSGRSWARVPFGVSRSRGVHGAWAPARRLAVVLAVVVCGVLALGAGSAFALLTFPFDGQLAPAGGSFGTLEAGSVAVNDSNGDTYVADASSGVVDVFETVSGSQLAGLDGSLTPAGSFGGGQVEVAANNGTGDVYVLDSTHNVVDVFSSAGGYVCQITGKATPSASECNGAGGSDTPAHGFSTPGGIAVDQATGNIYVVDANHGAVDIFSSAGAYLRQISLASIEGGFNATYTRGIAVDDFNGEVFVSDSGSPNPAGEDVVYVFNAAGEYQTTWTGIPGRAFGGGYVSVAADNASGDVFVTSTVHGATDVFEPSGGYITQFSHSFNQPQGTAVDQAAHKIYVSDSSPSVVDVFGPGPVLVPDVTTGSASGAQPASITLEGAVNPDGVQVTACQFEYGTTSGYGQSAPCAPAPGSGSSEVPVSAEVTGLQPNTTYHYRLSAANANGANSGGDATFTTPGPPTVDGESSTEVTQSAASLQAQVKPNGLDTTYHFQYGTSTAYGTTVPIPDGDAGSGTVDVAVSVPAEGLSLATTYHYRVVATNSAGTTFGQDETFTTLPALQIDSESVSDVTSSSATLATQINPLGSDTTYRFEYGPTTAYGTRVPVPDGHTGAGTGDVPLSTLVEGLTPNTTYHYRVVASNPLGAGSGLDHAFTTQGGEVPVLPDGRAWEMVSPPNKRGVALETIGSRGGGEIQAAADGSAIAYVAQGPIDAEPKGARSIALSQILSKRTPSGWTSLDIATSHEAVAGTNGIDLSEYQVFSPDLSVGLVEPQGDTPLSPQATERTQYLREANGEYTPLVTAANVPPGTKFGQLLPRRSLPVEGAVRFAGATPDLSHVILSSSPPLTEGIAEPESTFFGPPSNLFEWSGGSLRLVSVLPDGKAATEVPGGGAALGLTGVGDNVRHVVSDDGGRVFWADGSALYMRDMGNGETIRLDVVEAGALGGSERAEFATASSDGSKVFFKDTSRLTLDSHAGPAPDLYMCVVGEVAGKLACRLKDLTADRNAGESGAVQGTVIGAGEDGRYVYFVANGVLAAGAVPGNCSEGGNGSACNLYVYDTVLGEVKFVAQLSAKDFEDWRAYSGEDLSLLTAGVSPDGRYLAFMSERSLTGYDSIDVRSGQPDVEVFLYDAGTGRVVCPSCNPSGARPSGVFDSGNMPGLLVDRGGGFEGPNWGGHWLAGSIPGWTNVTGFRAFYRSRYLSNSGRLFFDSADALVPRDANGKEDVYEYETQGVGGCTRAGGCVGLISSGSSGEESAFLDASESGNDVFFLTSSQLVPQDLDNALDVYDARVCSPSSPCLAPSPVGSPPCATADACRAAPASPPAVFGAPPSATFSGAGNLTPSVTKAAVKKKVLTVAQKRAAALRRCRSKPRRRRASCEAQARRAYRVGVRAKRSRDGVTTRKGNR